jgi:hypothetical protein
MNKLTKLAFLGLALVSMLGLSACTSDGKTFPDGEVRQFTVTLDDGTQVPCIKVKDLYGIDCNWDKAQRVKSVTP